MTDFEDMDPPVATYPTPVRPDSISSMGQLLLQGYAMLAESCETCGVRFCFCCLSMSPSSSPFLCNRIANCATNASSTLDHPQPGPFNEKTQ